RGRGARKWIVTLDMQRRPSATADGARGAKTEAGLAHGAVLSGWWCRLLDRRRCGAGRDVGGGVLLDFFPAGGNLWLIKFAKEEAKQDLGNHGLERSRVFGEAVLEQIGLTGIVARRIVVGSEDLERLG